MLLTNAYLFFLSATRPDDQLKEATSLSREMLSLLNANASSALPHAAKAVLERWVLGHTSQSPIVRAMLRTAGGAVTRPEALAPMLEAVLLAYFCDEEDDVVVGGGSDVSGECDRNKKVGAKSLFGLFLV